MASQGAKLVVVAGSRASRFSRGSAIGLATATAVSYATVQAEEAYSRVDSIADSFVCTTLAYKETRKIQHQTDLRERLLHSALELDRRVDWSLKKHATLSGLLSAVSSLLPLYTNDEEQAFGDSRCDNSSLLVYRLEWMKVYLRNLCAQLELQLRQQQLLPSEENENLEKKKAMYTYEDECSLFYDILVDDPCFLDYLDTTKAAAAHAKLVELLPPLKNNGWNRNNNEPLLHERVHQYTSKLMIPKSQYETTFRKLIGTVLADCAEMIPELQTATLVQEYMDDVKESCEAYVDVGPTFPNTRQSKMVVNLARSISYDKAQQLAVHELTHFVQFVLLEDYLYQCCPELRVANDVLELGPLSLLMEGGAEFFVEAFYDGSSETRDRQTQLQQPFMVPQHVLRLPHYDASTILAIESFTWFGLWSTCTCIARNFHNKNQNSFATTTTTNNNNKKTAQQELLHRAFKQNNSWPNADFFEQVGAYSLGYGFGKELIKAYCQHQAKSKGTTAMDEYIRFMKRPVRPSNMQRVLMKQSMY